MQPLSLSVLGARVSGWTAGPEGAANVLLLHGARFSSETWKGLGTPTALGPGVRSIAVDLPGYGGSEPQATDAAPAEWLLALFDALALERAVLVAPSMSGCFALPFAAAHPGRLLGIVPVAPACSESLAGPVDVPALILWGESDRVFPLQPLPSGSPHPGAANRAEALAAAFPGSRVELFPGASHPCYLDDPERFHALLIGFLEEERPDRGGRARSK